MANPRHGTVPGLLLPPAAANMTKRIGMFNSIVYYSFNTVKEEHWYSTGVYEQVTGTNSYTETPCPYVYSRTAGGQGL